ncbi:hypothetical protein LCGC14_1184060 [marine sediment metagenome]|uniref:Uncharacterized protein n=1 Tax=marine sediment metagenome TaxID=412755 RepID=A0A0F9M928_9ZZZZ|nr:hypothetical protein [Candidatus Aminicenantes bacterium]
MSEWTQMAGVISFDSRGSETSLEQLEFDINDEARPYGSEGPMHFSIGCTGRWDTLVFTGNLRDFSEEEIEKYLIPYFGHIIQILKYSQNHARDGIISMWSSRTKPIILIYDQSVGNWLVSNDAFPKFWENQP